MSNDVAPPLPGQVRGRPFPKGAVGKPRRPPVWLTQKATMAAPLSARPHSVFQPEDERPL